MDQSAILARITDVVRDELDDDALALTPATRASDVAGWDSLAHVRIVVGVEQAFKVRFATSDIARLKTVGDLVGLVQRGLA